MTPAPVLMVQGTSSGAGKSLLAAAFCRIFTRRGLSVLPFKAQNMSNNAAVVEGGEMGRAQVLQARAAGVAPRLVMNPVLVKPMADTRSEVVVLGRSAPQVARLPWTGRREILWPVVRSSLHQLRGEADLVVVEGAGSPAEINLRQGDIVNMAVAREAGAAVLLVSDIDRGGAFASLYGTWALLDDADRRHIRGFILNRFRGDASLLAPAPAELEARTGVPVLGVVPWVPHHLPEEDAAGLGEARRGDPVPGPFPERQVVAVVRFPHISNMDDLDPLGADPGVELRWVSEAAELQGASAMVLPGTRNTPGDLAWLRERGLDTGIVQAAARGVPILGICGGYQVLGERVEDPEGIEGAPAVLRGLGLLPVRTVHRPVKETRTTIAVTVGGDGPPEGLTLPGYEIRHGETLRVPGEVTPDTAAPPAESGGAAADDAVPWLRDGERILGFRRGNVAGCTLHGVLENESFRRWWRGTWPTGAEAAEPQGGRAEPQGGGPAPPRVAGPVDAGGAAATPETRVQTSWEMRLEAELDRLADAVEAALDIDLILALARAGVSGGEAR